MGAVADLESIFRVWFCITLVQIITTMHTNGKCFSDNSWLYSWVWPSSKKNNKKNQLVNFLLLVTKKYDIPNDSKNGELIRVPSNKNNEKCSVSLDF